MDSQVICCIRMNEARERANVSEPLTNERTLWEVANMAHKSLRERFEQKYQPVTETGCWLWTASLGPRGYGNFNRAGSIERAHRVSFELYVGPIPNDLSVLHKCDTPTCVNPAHLFLGTQLENVVDRQMKERNARGERMATSRLTEHDVRMIRADDGTYADIARRFDVHQTTVRNVLLRKTWRHIP